MPHPDPQPNGPVDVAVNGALLDNIHPPDWQNPVPSGKYNLVVIGAGPAGLTAARSAAALGARVALIERDRIGGNSLSVGCVPSKAIIRTSRLYADMRDARSYGVPAADRMDHDFTAVMQRMRRVQTRISRSDAARRLQGQGIELFMGAAQFTGPGTVAVAGSTLHFKKAVIATGARPVTPDIPGLKDAGYLTNENVFRLTERPRRLLVIGGGALGCELAQAFCRLGSQVVIAQSDPMFLSMEERDAAQILSDSMARDGVEIHLNSAVVAVRMEDEKKVAELVSDGNRSSLAVDEILVGIGRAPNVEGLNLDAAGVEYDTKTGVLVNDFQQTSNARIYAAGDVCLEQKYTHTADASARIVVQNALFMGRKRFSALTIPRCTYTDPEIAHVGLSVRDAWENSIPVRTFTILMHDVDRAITDGEDDGFVKIHVRQGSDQILGATVVARHAGEMINGISLAISCKIGLRRLAKVIHAYPTQAEAIKMAADAYNRTRLTPTLKARARRWLAW